LGSIGAGELAVMTTGDRSAPATPRALQPRTST
jgi:hypothetical protein